jgi:hypothetical protein
MFKFISLLLNFKVKNMNRKSLLLQSILLLFVVKGLAQGPWVYGSFDNIFDDREYFSGQANSQTILGARFDAGIAFKVDSVHQIAAGMNYMFEYGSDPFALKPVPDLYYKYSIDHFRAFFGSFPRYKLLNFPLALLTDSILYYRPNIQGGLMEASGDWGYQNAFCDWTGRQTTTVHEAFMAGISGHIKYSIIYFEDYFYMYHFAGLIDNPTWVQDNGGGAFYVGIDLARKTILDKCNFDIGGVTSYFRVRPADYNHIWGMQGRASLFYKFFGIDATYYKGGKLFLVWGDLFYRTGNYGRLDTYLKLIKTKHVDTKIDWSFHFVKGYAVDNSYQVMIRIDFPFNKN